MGRPLVLCYHTVADQKHPMAVPADRLRRQVEMLLRRGYEPVTFTEAALAPPHRRCVAVTFDDGFGAVRDRAYPVLSALGVPGTAFLPTGLMDAATPMSWSGFDPTPLPADELAPLSWDAIRALADAGWEIGSHTVSHPRLTTLDDESLRRELEDSKRECEQHLQTECRSIAYPFGDVDERVLSAARSAGYVAGALLGAATGRARSTLTTPRSGIYFADHDLRFRAKVSPAVAAPLGVALRGVRRLTG